MKVYRNNGAVGALLDEYERAIDDLMNTITGIPDEHLKFIVDPETKDESCRSIQSILTHVVKAGYNYAIVIRKNQGEQIDYYDPVSYTSGTEYKDEIRKMFDFNVLLFQDYPNLKLEEKVSENKILVKWGQRYDVEQLFEHAIVHILRHRRQIERFLLKLNN